MSEQLPKLIVVLGFTGSGKSDLAVQLAQEHNGEIVSADSRQIYKEMDIGTGKVIGQWQEDKYVYRDINHYLIDFLSIGQAYSVGEYKEAAEKEIDNIIQSGKSPILAGGTAQYIYAVVDNWQIPRVAPDIKFRKDYEDKLELRKISLEQLWADLIKQDPEAAEFVQENNPRRIIRALEVIKATGQKFSEIRKKEPAKYKSTIIGIKYEREELYEKIDKRVDQMELEGLEKEAVGLLNKYGHDAPGLQTIGYQEFYDVIARSEVTKQSSLDRRGLTLAEPRDDKLQEVVQKIKFNTHRYVRYQNSWFNKDERIKWIKDYSEVKELINK